MSRKEIETMKKLMTDKKMLHWASASVWGYGVKNGMISMARTTWYHYGKLLRLGNSRKKYKPNKKKISVRAEAPNTIWHMDVSVYKTLENTKSVKEKTRQKITTELRESFIKSMTTLL